MIEPKKSKDEAAQELHDEMKDDAWFSCIGISDETLIIYTKKVVNSRRLDRLKVSGWRGYRVQVENCGIIKPAEGISAEDFDAVTEYMRINNMLRK
jgi:hypothetical protein